MTYSLQPHCNCVCVNTGSTLVHFFDCCACKETKLQIFCQCEWCADILSAGRAWRCRCVVVWAACWRVTSSPASSLLILSLWFSGAGPFSFCLLLQQYECSLSVHARSLFLCTHIFNNNHVTLSSFHSLILCSFALILTYQHKKHFWSSSHHY